MGEMLQNLQHIYAKWEDKNQPPRQLLSLARPRTNIIPAGANSISRFRNGPHFRSRREDQNSSVPTLRHPPCGYLGDFKVNPIVHPIKTGNRPYMGRCCNKCLPFSRESLVDEETSILGTDNLILVPTMNEDNNFFVRKFAYMVHTFRTNILGNPDVTNSVMRDERILKAIERTVEEDIEENGLPGDAYGVEVKKKLLNVLRLLSKIKASIFSSIIKIVMWLFYKYMSRVVVSLQVNNGQMKALKRAREVGIPLIFLPLHRSHLDSLLVSFAALNSGVDIPIVAAGDNLAIPMIGRVLQWHGAFFIKRKWDPQCGKKDFIYRALINSYLENNLKNNKNVEFFAEGGRTRTGRALLPKAGLLSIVMNIYLSGYISDAYIVPVSISYDKLMDGNFVSEELGHSKKSESTMATFKAIWNRLKSYYGMIRIDYAQPFSLREFVDTTKSHYRTKNPLLSATNLNLSERSELHSSSTPCLSGMVTPETYDDKELHKHLVSNLLKHAVYDATQCSAIMSTNVIAFLLLNKFRKGIKKSRLTLEMEWLVEELFLRGRDVGFSGSMADVVHYALSFWGQEFITLKKLNAEDQSLSVQTDKENDFFIEPVVSLPQVLELSYYSNHVTSVFLMDSVIANALYTFLNVNLDAFVDCESQISVSRQQLQEKAEFLCDVLKFDFIFVPPCTSISTAVIEAISKFINEEILHSASSYNVNNNCETHRPGRKPTRQEFDSDSDDDTFQDENLIVDLSPHSVEKLDFFRNILSAILESYWLVASCLSILLNQQLEEHEFLKEVRSHVYSQIANGVVLHEECISSSTLQHAIKLFEDWKVVEIYAKDKLRIIYLTEEYCNEEQLAKILNSLTQFKK